VSGERKSKTFPKKGTEKQGPNTTKKEKTAKRIIWGVLEKKGQKKKRETKEGWGV